MPVVYVRSTDYLRLVKLGVNPTDFVNSAVSEKIDRQTLGKDAQKQTVVEGSGLTDEQMRKFTWDMFDYGWMAGCLYMTRVFLREDWSGVMPELAKKSIILTIDRQNVYWRKVDWEAAFDGKIFGKPRERKLLTAEASNTE